MRLPRPFVIAGLCLAPVAVIAQIPASTTVPAVRAPEEIIDSLRLRDAPLDLIIDRLEVWTGRIVLRPQALPQTQITINIAKPIPKSEAVQAIISVLALNNIGVVEMGDKYLKIVELANKTRTEAPELVTGSLMNVPPSGKVASKVFELTNLKAQDFVPQLNTLLNVQLGGAVLFNNTNSFLVTDSISNLQRVEQLLLSLDRPAATDFAPKFYTLRFAKASDLVSRIKQLLQGPSQQSVANSLSLNADDRTNQAILIADTRQHPFFDELIAKLDVKADPNTRTDVLKLNNAKAVDVATLLSQLVTGQTAAAKTAGQTPDARNNNNRANAAAPAAGNAAAPAAALVQNAASAETFSSLLTILADERSNAIVVSGTADDIRLLRDLVTKIDVLLAQVRVEVVIAEVTLSDDSTTGVDSLGLRVENNKLTGFSAAGPGASIGGIGTDFATSSGYGQNLTAAIGLSTTPRKNNTTILSVPTIVTSHNKEAEIFVGETRPVISGTTSAASGGTTGLTTSSTVTQQEIGIRLKVTPLIGPDGSVQMEIEQEVEDVLGTVTIDGNEQPRIGRRTTTSFVSAANGDIIVLGGLQRESNSKITSRLGPIPFLGDLFGRRSRTKSRTELIFFLRPVVLTNTVRDNAEVLQRLETNPQGKAIRAVIEARPAAATPVTPSESLPATQP
ncbi:secretin N-terminal domain-containing protein [Rariglobus hedericola]|uniref:Type II secretory pathway, component PulD n=1 Tax=Rariglobus hedericola TaxID=2597822 RepID=A0A556QJT2_9BACT|nr:secretin N-terminal domain-containing protein [Rariglobus hedericola]TSJ76877.1 type II secretory pathway, component PulD [Rariglobus hedericola]